MADANRIWTLAHMVAALGLALVAYLSAIRLMVAWPDPVLFGYFPYVSAGFGLAVGWRVIGNRVGFGISTGVAAGVTGAVVLVALVFVVLSFYEAMARNMSMGNVAPEVVMARYWSLVKGWGLNMTDPLFWAMLLGGGAVTGALAEWLSPKQA